jgi:hypothetical protein
MKKLLLTLLVSSCFLATQGLAQEKPAGGKEEGGHKEAHHGKSADEVAKELANPNNSLASLTFKNQFRWYTGDLPNADDQFNYTLLFQPVFPFNVAAPSEGDKANLFIRPAIPILVEQPVFNAQTSDFDGTSALGDIGFDLAYGVTTKTGLLYAAGMVGTIPTATDSHVAGKEWRLGPEMLIAKFYKWGLFGVFPNHQWDVGGWSDGVGFSTTQIQAFLKFVCGNGWTVGSLPIMTYDWKTEAWTIPLQVDVSKTIIFGKTPVKVEIEMNYYLKRPDQFGPEFMLGLNLTPVVSNIFARWIQGK